MDVLSPSLPPPSLSLLRLRSLSNTLAPQSADESVARCGRARCDKEGRKEGRKAEVNLIVVRHAKQSAVAAVEAERRCFRSTFEKWKGGRWEDYYKSELPQTKNAVPGA